VCEHKGSLHVATLFTLRRTEASGVKTPRSGKSTARLKPCPDDSRNQGTTHVWTYLDLRRSLRFALLWHFRKCPNGSPRALASRLSCAN
jgi:hypothetical protein